MTVKETKTERLVARVNHDVKDIIEKAAYYAGSSVSQFVIDSSLERANNIISEMEILRLSDDALNRMMDILDNPPKPNAYLMKMRDRYIKNGHANNTSSETP